MQNQSELLATVPANSSARNCGRALVVSSNSEVQSVIAEALRLRGISCDYAWSGLESDKRLRGQKFEAVFVDSDLPERGLLYLQKLRSDSRLGRIVLVAITHTNSETAQAFVYGAQFCVQGEGSIQRVTLDRVLRAAYGSILRECRRYFRCALAGNVVGQRENEPVWNGQLVNISEGGICFIAEVQLTPGQSIIARFRLPSPEVDITAKYRIQWSNVNGRAGAQFVYLDGKSKQELHHWLATQFELILPPGTVPKFTK